VFLSTLAFQLMLASLFFRRYNFGLYNLNLYCYYCLCKHCLSVVGLLWQVSLLFLASLLAVVNFHFVAGVYAVAGVPVVAIIFTFLASMLLLMSFLLSLSYLPCSCPLFSCWCPRPCCGWCPPPCCGSRPFVPAASGIPAVAGVLTVSQYGPLFGITIRIPITDKVRTNLCSCYWNIRISDMEYRSGEHGKLSNYCISVKTKNGYKAMPNVII